MALTLTTNTFSAVNQVAKEPNLVLEIDGIDTLFGVIPIKKYALIGDPDLEIGDPETDPDAFYIGGFNLVADQDTAILLDGTTTNISQTLNVDKGEGGSVSSLNVALIDDGTVTEIITPNLIVPDMLQRKCKLYLGFSNVAWPEDYVIIFRGVINDITSDPGKVIFQIAHPDDKKRGTLYKKVDAVLQSSISNSDTSLTLVSAVNILQKVLGPDGTYDPSFEALVRIDNEVMKFETISGSTLQTLTRGYLNTTAASHSAGAQVTTIYRLKGNGIELALKLLASGFGGDYLEDVEVSAFLFTDIGEIPNAIYFNGFSVKDKYNIAEGDFITVTGATNGANNVTAKVILEVNDTNDGSYIVVDGVSFVLENPTAAEINFRSQYDTLPEGLKFTNDEIDIDEHLRWFNLFLSSVNYDFYLKDTIENVREFIELEIYSPMAAYSLPRKSRASMGYHSGPIPGDNIQVFDETNLRSPTRIKVKRTTNRQFYNEIVYRFDDALLEDKFQTGNITISADSKNRIKGYNKTLTISSKGLRSTDLGEAIASQQSLRRLNRYKFGAEQFGLEPMFGDSFNTEIGDIVVFDGSELNLPDIKTGQKGMAPRFLEVQNKTLNIKTGDVKVDAVDTNFDGQARYGLISPSSKVSAGVSALSFSVKESFSGKFGPQEYRKWANLNQSGIIVRDEDGSPISDSVLTSQVTNNFSVSPALSFTPSVDQIVEFDDYESLATSDRQKLIYAYMNDNATFLDGSDQYLML
jgi:hypothetical protein